MKAIDRMRARIQSLRTELVAAESVANQLRAKIQILEELCAEEDDGGMATSPSKSLVEACEWAIDHFAQSGPMRAREVVAKLKEHGFPEAAENFQQIVFVTLKRLAVKGLIAKEKQDGKTLFRAIPGKALL